jgi:2-desacetyl-2-hydroxyethyl bacteriochlorophyllide A dehydrogenase
MRAAVIGSAGSFEITDLPDPTPGAGELLVRVSACGLCGSDIKAREAMPEGTVMGHEFGGTVVGVGSGLTEWSEGTAVAVLPVTPCGNCTWCRSGYVIHCTNNQLLGLGGAPGGFAEYAVVSALSATRVPSQVELAYSALVEPYAVGLHSVRTGNVSAEDDVLIIGAGSVGSTTAAWSTLHTAGRVTVVDPSTSRRDAVLRVGATDAVASLDEVEPGSYDVVIECVGKPGLIDQAIAATRPRSRVVVAGVCFEPDSLSSISALMKEVTIGFAVYYTPEEFQAVVEAFTDGRIDPQLLLGGRIGLDGLNQAFDDFGASAGAKILIEP